MKNYLRTAVAAVGLAALIGCNSYSPTEPPPKDPPPAPLPYAVRATLSEFGTFYNALGLYIFFATGPTSSEDTRRIPINQPYGAYPDMKLFAGLDNFTRNIARDSIPGEIGDYLNPLDHRLGVVKRDTLYPAQTMRHFSQLVTAFIPGETTYVRVTLKNLQPRNNQSIVFKVINPKK